MSTTHSLFAAAAFALPALSFVSASTTTYNILHRISSFDSTPEWSVRGTVTLASLSISTGSNATLDVSVLNQLSSDDVKSLKQKAEADDAGEMWYQIAISPSSSASTPTPQQVQLETSVKLCHLRQSHTELPTIDDEISLNTRNSASSADILVTGLAYRVLDISLDQRSCPIPSLHKINLVRAEAKRQRQRELSRRSARKSPKPATPPTVAFKLNTKLSIRSATIAPPITLKQALPTNHDGTVQQPPAEKSFLHKYWFYLIPVAILLIMPPGEDEKPGAEAHPSSEHPGNGLGAKKLN